MVNAESKRLSPFGYNEPTIDDIFGLKNPLPRIKKRSPVHIKIFAVERSVEKVLAGPKRKI
jgi:hypothetical protein